MVSWNFVELDEVGSTQAVVKGLASMGSPEGTTVVAKTQSSGAGRLQRPWASPRGGLYMSFLLRPHELTQPEAITLAAAVSVAEGVRLSTGLVAKIRWPNDVLLGKKKVAGVIAEAQFYKKELVQVIVGIGVNCNSSFKAHDPLKDEDTSLVDELGEPIEVSELRQAVLDSFSGLYERLQAGSEVLSLWRQHLSTLGKQVSIKMKTEETPFSCLAIDIDAGGGLVVETAGERKVLRAEDMEWLREQA